ncbi:class I SAM-dependent methyltransferase [Paenibacillus sp. N1-5-1-14]|uniref:class I SAM-dependent methyltransferase n=1 Tax=Paenibacillus radicibacter TaxID=2972488 RepID=UPI0021596646|nr:class I SAM-dependent methyltransferase [Paenibacillus radicibacter]MCR8644606.1 class I SAM-dependent methyltransferase [Paenibacillus radicibacter]
MPDHTSIYLNEAEKYHLLISKQPKLAKIIGEIQAYEGLDIVDMGAGSGRLTTVLVPDARTIIALDQSQAMLDETAEKLMDAGLMNWKIAVADHRKLPVADQSADLIVAGWTICYLVQSGLPQWKQNLEEIMLEMKRVLRPGGTIIIFETMGTGYETPNPPDFLIEYYASLVADYGFAHKWMRTDYQFDSVEQAVELTKFFFSTELADQVRKDNKAQVPECAGIWWLHV